MTNAARYKYEGKKKKRKKKRRWRKATLSVICPRIESINGYVVITGKYRCVLCTVCESNFKAFKIISLIKSWLRYGGIGRMGGERERKKKKCFRSALSKKACTVREESWLCHEIVLLLSRHRLLLSCQAFASRESVHAIYLHNTGISLMRLYIYLRYTPSHWQYIYNIRINISRARAWRIFLWERERERGKRMQFFRHVLSLISLSRCMMLCFNSFSFPLSPPVNHLRLRLPNAFPTSCSRSSGRIESIRFTQN